MNEIETVGTNAISLVQSLPSYSHRRAPLIASLTTNLPSSTVHNLFGISASYARQCKRKPTEQLMTQYPNKVKRKKISNDERTTIQQLIADYCPTKSGTPSLIYFQYMQNNELYSKYIESTPIPRCYKTFIKVKTQMPIRVVKAYYGQFDCWTCLEYHQLQ